MFSLFLRNDILRVLSKIIAYRFTASTQHGLVNTLSIFWSKLASLFPLVNIMPVFAVDERHRLAQNDRGSSDHFLSGVLI